MSVYSHQLCVEDHETGESVPVWVRENERPLHSDPHLPPASHPPPRPRPSSSLLFTDKLLLRVDELGGGMNGPVFFTGTGRPIHTQLFHISNSLLCQRAVNTGLCWETYATELPVAQTEGSLRDPGCDGIIKFQINYIQCFVFRCIFQWCFCYALNSPQHVVLIACVCVVCVLA